MTSVDFLKERINNYNSNITLEDTLYLMRLILTHQCNLNCEYCYEKHKDCQSMEFEIAKQIIDNEYKKALDQNSSLFVISLFGGEPNLKFELIKQIEEYLTSLDYNIPYVLSITTNGVNFTEEQKHWYLEHKSTVELSLSIDGDKLTQNLHRGHFDDIDIKFFATNYPNQFFNMTIMPDTLKYFMDNINFLSQFNVPINCNLASGYVFEDKSDIDLFISNLRKLADLYLTDITQKPISTLNVIQLTDLVMPHKCYYTCGFNTYDCDGKKYLCNESLPFVLGDIKLNNPLYIKQELIPVKCLTCKLHKGCLECAALNAIITQDATKVDNKNCMIKKAIYHELASFAIALEKQDLLNGYDEGIHKKILEGALLVLESEGINYEI